VESARETAVADHVNVAPPDMRRRHLPLGDGRVLDRCRRKKLALAADDDGEVLHEDVLAAIEPEHRSIVRPRPPQLCYQRPLAAELKPAHSNDLQRVGDDELALRQGDPTADAVLDLRVNDALQVLGHADLLSRRVRAGRPQRSTRSQPHTQHVRPRQEASVGAAGRTPTAFVTFRVSAVRWREDMPTPRRLQSDSWCRGRGADTLPAHLMGIRAEALDGAERAGLARVRGNELELRCPLVRSAVYQAAPLSKRWAVHRALASALDGEQVCQINGVTVVA
jgi:hypothetical protein